MDLAEVIIKWELQRIKEKSEENSTPAPESDVTETAIKTESPEPEAKRPKLALQVHRELTYLLYSIRIRVLQMQYSLY